MQENLKLIGGIEIGCAVLCGLWFGAKVGMPFGVAFLLAGVVGGVLFIAFGEVLEHLVATKQSTRMTMPAPPP